MGYKDTKETIYMEIKYGKRKRAYHIGKLSFVTNKHTWRLEISLIVSIYKETILPTNLAFLNLSIISLEADFASVYSSVFLMTDRDLFHSTLPGVHHYNTTSKVLYHMFPHKCQVFSQTVPK